MPRTLSLLVAAVAVVVLAAGCGSKSSAKSSSETTATSSSGLVGTVGPGFTISLTKDGTAVKTLTPGTYEITVNDQASIHDFHLTGPGVDKTTDVAFTGTVTWTVKLTTGTYNYLCDPHAATMMGSFTVS
ncbi:MAG: plastocyanin/azurin family copper-binding protein [Gaiellaceae bacterium]